MLTSLDIRRFSEIATGYTSSQRYRVHRSNQETSASFSLVLEDLEVPYIKWWEYDLKELANYQHLMAEQKLSFQPRNFMMLKNKSNRLLCTMKCFHT